MMTALSQIQPVALRDLAVQQIRTAIIEGRLKPNDHITEIPLTEQLGISRTPLREALILLEREGLIVTVPNRGSFVRAFNAQDIDEIFSLRVALENLVGDLIIGSLTSDDFELLEQSVAQQEAAIKRGDFRLVRSVDMNFHEYLVRKTGHSRLIRDWMEIVAQIAAVLYMRAEAISNYDEYQSIRDHQCLRRVRSRSVVCPQRANQPASCRRV